MMAQKLIVILEMVFFFGGILLFCWWQMRLMDKGVDDSKGSALARRPAEPEADGAAESKAA